MRISYETLIEVSDPQDVEIVIDRNGARLWINIDGVCRLRCRNILELHTTAEQGVTGWRQAQTQFDKYNMSKLVPR